LSARGERPRGSRAAEQRSEMPTPHLIIFAHNAFSISTVRRKNDAEKHTLVYAFLLERRHQARSHY
jgi:hypothetical protein